MRLARLALSDAPGSSPMTRCVPPTHHRTNRGRTAHAIDTGPAITVAAATRRSGRAGAPAITQRRGRQTHRGETGQEPGIRRPAGKRDHHTCPPGPDAHCARLVHYSGRRAAQAASAWGANWRRQPTHPAGFAATAVIVVDGGDPAAYASAVRDLWNAARSRFVGNGRHCHESGIST